MKISYRYLIDPDETREALRTFVTQEVIGLDTETFWDSSSGQNHLSLLQIAAPDGVVLVIDGLAAGIEQARPIIEDAGILMVAHNARFDEGSLKSAGFAPAGMVDTLRLARRALSLKSFSLSSVTSHLCGREVDKTYQRSNWRDRPLMRAQLDYAALDARTVLDVYQALEEKLRLEGKWEKEQERARLDRKHKKEPRAPKEQKPLLDRPWTSEERRLLSYLHAWRTAMARTSRLPDYFICSDRTLDHLVVLRPQALDQLEQVFGLGPAKIEKFGSLILEQLMAFR